MDARALVAEEGGAVELRDVELPDPGPAEVAVRVRYSGVSAGTERNILRGDVDWGPFPVCTGYQAVGVVESAGEAVDGYEPGDAVYLRDNSAPELPDGTAVSPTAGLHCSRAVVDPETSHGFGRLPEGAPAAAASTYVLAAVGLNGVDMAGVSMAETVAVQGVGLVGLGVVAAAHRRGAEVIALDLDPDRREVAAALGADHAIDPAERDPVAAVAELTGGPAADGGTADEAPEGGADVAVEATGLPELIGDAMALGRRRGKFVFQGDYGDRDVSFYFRRPHHGELTTFFPCNDGLEPGRRAVLSQMASGALPWDRALTDVLAPDEAPAFYADLYEGGGPAVGAAVDWT